MYRGRSARPHRAPPHSEARRGRSHADSEVAESVPLLVPRCHREPTSQALGQVGRRTSAAPIFGGSVRIRTGAAWAHHLLRKDSDGGDRSISRALAPSRPQRCYRRLAELGECMEDDNLFGSRSLTQEFQRLRAVVPEVNEHRQALKILGADFSHIRKYTDGSWVTLVSPGEMLSGRFGLTRDIMLTYSVSEELQPAVLRQFDKRRSDLPRDKACEDHFVIVWSKDPTAPAKLAAWAHQESMLGVYLQRTGRPDAVAASLLAEMRRKLASRNLYAETLPVTGDDFFGRRRELTQLQDELRQGKVCGVFGLRKTGKTSLIKELGRRFTLDR